MTDHIPASALERAHHEYYEHARGIDDATSRVRALRRFNNWVKSVLISEYTMQGFTVLDLCCGKGGDLPKYKFARIAFYVGVDLSKKCIQEAKERYSQLNLGFEALLIAGDVADPEITIDSIVRNDFDIEYDLVSCQFALNYILESEMRLRRFLNNVSEKLKPGGVVIGTVPDCNVLVKKLRTCGQSMTFGNKYYSVRFNKTHFPRSEGAFGLKYGFYLEGSVGNIIQRQEGVEIEYVPENLVIMEQVEIIAREYDLELIYKKNFHDLYSDFKNKYEKLLKIRMSDCSMDEDQWDIAYLYSAFVFRKRGEFKRPPRNSHAGNNVNIRYMRDDEID
jgi:mRNA (guanine-N7-)-methyltransferase